MIGELRGEAVDGGKISVDNGSLFVGEREFLEEAQDVVLGLDELDERRLAGSVEVASGARHPVDALVEELVCTEAVAQVVEAPGLPLDGGLLYVKDRPM